MADTKLSTTSKPKRPASVTLLVLFVLIIASLNSIRFILAIRQWDFLSDRLGISPLYLAVSGLGLALFSWPLGLGLFFARSWALCWMRLAVILYGLFYWSERIGFAWYSAGEISPRALIEELPNLWFLFCATILGVVYVFWTLSRPKIKNFFGEAHERTSGN